METSVKMKVTIRRSQDVEYVSGSPVWSDKGASVQGARDSSLKTHGFQARRPEDGGGSPYADSHPELEPSPLNVSPLCTTFVTPLRRAVYPLVGLVTVTLLSPTRLKIVNGADGTTTSVLGESARTKVNSRTCGQ